jgi:putative ABC transport system ATP-binding protein
MALVRVLQLDPFVLLLDEPTAALDANAAGAVERALDDWCSDASAQRAMVWVSHDPEQASRVSNRRMLMDSGRIAGEDLQ